MEQIIQQIQELESLNKREEEKIEQERSKHQESFRAKEKVLIEIDELDKRNQALSESIFQFEINLDGTRQQNNDVKCLLKESKIRLRQMQNQLDKRKVEMEVLRGEIASKIHEINIQFSAKIKENSLENVARQVENLKKKYAELKRREELKKKFEPVEEFERITCSTVNMEKEETNLDVTLSAKSLLIERKKKELDLLRQYTEKLTTLADQEMSADFYLLVEPKFSDKVPPNMISSLLDEKSKLLVLRERLAEEDCMASTLEEKFEKTAEKTQELSKTLSSLTCSKCSISMSI